jgi:hypothetical protein
MIEVFKTDVKEVEHALILVTEITRQFSDYEVNFDLEDCDRILRVKCIGCVDASALIELIRGFGYSAEVLPDEEVPTAPAIAFPFFNLLNT